MIRGLQILLPLILITSCEKDDICIEGSENTNRITIGFLNNDNKNPTGISLKTIKGINNDSIIEEFSGSELKLPLKVNSNKTQFILEYSEIKDTLIIFHESFHTYLNRSCGFKSSFLIKSETETIKDSGWIREVSIVKDSIFNEEKTNIYIHY